MNEVLLSEAFLKILDIEDKKAHLAAKEDDYASALQKIEGLEKQSEELKELLEEKREALAIVLADLKNTAFDKKKEELEKLNETIQLCSNEAAVI